MKLSYFVRLILIVLFFWGASAVSQERGYACSDVYGTHNKNPTCSDSDGIIKGYFYSVEKKIGSSLTFAVFLENLSDRTQHVFLEYSEKGTRCAYYYIDLQAKIGGEWESVADSSELFTKSPLTIPAGEKVKIDFIFHFPVNYLQFPLRLKIGGHNNISTGAWKGIIFLEFSYKDVPIMRK